MSLYFGSSLQYQPNTPNDQVMGTDNFLINCTYTVKSKKPYPSAINQLSLFPWLLPHQEEGVGNDVKEKHPRPKELDAQAYEEVTHRQTEMQ